MQDSKSRQRIEFTVILLSDLDETIKEIKEKLSCVEGCTKDFFRNHFQKRKNEIHPDIAKYNENVRKMKNLNIGITAQINEWYGFLKNEKELEKLSFPIKYYFNKRKLSSFISKANESISNLVIENRFIMEHLTVWEHQLELDAIQLIRQEMDFKRYEELIKRKDAIISELKYLLPSIPHVCPVEIDTGNLNPLIEKILI